MRTIKLKHSGVVVNFSLNDVPHPPLLPFKTDANLERINRIWDDKPGVWNSDESPVVVKNVPIPIKYWKTVFGSKGSSPWKAGYWTAVKGKYFNAKVLVNAMRQTTAQGFWDQFSVNGKKMHFKEIQARLAAIRKEKDAHIAALAKEEHGDNFGKVFGYRKQGKWNIKTNPAEIAKQYRLMQKKKRIEGKEDGQSSMEQNSDSDGSDSDMEIDVA